MKFKSREIDKLIRYLEQKDISPNDAVDIIEASLPKAQESNMKFNWKMMRFTMYLWQRLEEEKGRNLNTKTETAKIVVASKNFVDLYEGYHNTRKFDPKKEAKNLFKLVTDPRQKHFFKSRYFVYPKTKKTIPQDHIDYLMQFPKDL
tara:strand:- start:121 stop:561 length:441 start_codon:yes stop_codon:yes gene_type:complete